MKKNKCTGILALLLIVMALVVYQYTKNNSINSEEQISVKEYDIVIYGGGPQAVASALKASETTKGEKTILIIVPEAKLGSIFTAGGQNLFDLRHYKSEKLPVGLPKDYNWAQGGSMYLFYKDPSMVFSTETMENTLVEHVEKHKNIKVLYEHDIESVFSNTKTETIESVIVYPLKKGKNLRYVYDTNKPMKVKSPIFIDASESGKLTYISGLFSGTTGREDEGKDSKQMVATLMFKLKNLNMENVQQHQKNGAPFKFYFSHKGSLGILGGYEINGSSEFKEYSDNNPSFRLKPYNGGEDGYAGKNKQTEDTEMWMNMLLVYDVDGRKMWRDKVANNGNYPKDGGLDPEVAREMAINELKTPEFLDLIRKLPGLEKSELVLNNVGEPEVAEIMYVRETIHASNEDGTYSLKREDTYGMNDEKHYERRIGLGFYNFDSNTYTKNEELSEPRTTAPWYVPYEILTSKPKNLLIPGYAANMDSYSWRAMRVYPNLIVLGDAAGVAAGLNSMGKFNIKKPTDEHIKVLQKELIKQNAILEK